MKKFRYDYNYKLFIITNLLSCLFLFGTIISYNKYFLDNKYFLSFWLFIIMFMINFINSFVFINNQGIRVKNDTIKIVDYFWFTKINLVDLKRVELKEIKKSKKSNLYGLLNEFYHPSTYMYKSDYVYNNGRVFKIIFYLGDNSTRESYFGWMYKERSITKVNKVVNKLENFISEINLLIKKKQKDKLLIRKNIINFTQILIDNDTIIEK